MVKNNPNCKRCSLHETTDTVCLMGQGRVPSKVMVVSEAPGFRDGSGLLDKLLLQNGLSRSDVYITNAVRCHLPGDHKPSNGEIKACRFYNDKEISAVKPKFIILMGATALKSVLNEKGITEKHGSIIERDGITYLPTFHPAAALHEPRRMPDLNEDFKKFVRHIRGKPEEKHELNIIEVKDEDSLLDCIRDIQRNKCVSYDLETTGLDPRADDAAINTLQIGTKTAQWVIPLNIDWSPYKNKPKLQRAIIHKIAHAIDGVEEVGAHSKSSTFDNAWLWIHYKVRFKLTFETKIAAHLIDENQFNGLKYLAKIYPGAHDWDIDLNDKKGKGVSKEKFMEYAAYDAYYTRRLVLLFRKLLRAQDGLTELFRWLMMPAVRAFELIEQQGLYINKRQQEKVRKKLKKQIRTLEAKLKRVADINWGSPKQVGKVFFGKLGMSPLEYTPKGQPSTSESVMLRLADKHPAAKMLIELRGHQKNLSTYVDGWTPFIHGDYIYLSENLIGTVTGRMSSRLHQVPRNPMIRSLIDAPPGWVFFSADYGQIELRIAAMLSGCVALMEVFKRGIDVHLATACEMTGKHPDDVEKEERKQAKAVNFGLLYGMGPPKLVIYARDNYEVIITLGQAKAFSNRYFGKYSGLRPWHERQRRLVRSQGLVRNPVGRIRHLPNINSDEEFKRAEAERQAINSPVQGFASDLKLMALIELAQTVDWNECKIIGEVHDSILGIVRKDKIKHYMRHIQYTMESPALLRKFDVKIPVPIVVDIELGPWGSGKRWDGK